MSQYGSIPPPGAYVPPTQGAPTQGFQQQPAPSPYQPAASNYRPPGHPPKAGGAFGQMMNQAVSTGKPMLNKLGKTISSKLGTKPAPGPPQHLQSYQNYQEHQGQQGQPQGYQQQPGQSFSPQPQQQQWGQPQAQQQPQQQPQAPTAFVSPQQSPYQQSNYASPASGQSGQNNYFPQQTTQVPNSQPQTPQQPPTVPTYSANQFEQSGMTMEQQMQAQQGPLGQGQPMQPQPQTPFQQDQQPQAQYTGQGQPMQTQPQTPFQQDQQQQGQFAGQGQPMQAQPQTSFQQDQQAQGQYGGQAQPQIPFQQDQQAQGQYTAQGQQQTPFQPDQQMQGQYPGQQMGVVGSMQNPPQPQNVQSPHLANVSPEIPAQLGQPQWGYPQPGTEQLPPPGMQQQTGDPMNPGQPYQHVQTPPNQQEQLQQWNSTNPVSPQVQGQSQMPPHSISPPPPQIPSNKPLQSAQPPAPQTAPTEFIAELPADMGNLTLMESKPQVSESSAQYQAYHPTGPQKGSPSPGFTIPRRSVSNTSFPLADPWRFADPITELPTREFYILADLIFDALDRKFEPKNTGLLEAPKVLASWVKSTEDLRRIFSYKWYSAFDKMWSLEGIPHIMVPVQPSLTPNWNFNEHSHGTDMKLINEPPTYRSTYATYIPALNRAGWYKFFFLQMAHAPDDIGDLISALCSDIYKPGVLNHPDLNKRDRSEIPGLKAKAAEIVTFSIGRVCEETRCAMMVDPDVPLEQARPAAGSAQPSENMSPADMAVQMHKIQIERQFNDMAVRTVLGGGITFGPAGGYSGGYGSLV